MKLLSRILQHSNIFSHFQEEKMHAFFSKFKTLLNVFISSKEKLGLMRNALDRTSGRCVEGHLGSTRGCSIETGNDLRYETPIHFPLLTLALRRKSCSPFLV